MMATDATTPSPLLNQGGEPARAKVAKLNSPGDRPAVALLAAVVVMVSVLVAAEVPVRLRNEGEKVHVAPVGQPLITLKMTVPLNPYSGVTLRVVFPVCPGAAMVT